MKRALAVLLLLPLAVSASSPVRCEGKDAQAGAVTQAYPVQVGAYAEAQTGAMTSTSMAAGDVTVMKTDLEGRQFVRTDHPNRFKGVVTNSTATTLTQMNSAATSGLSYYITDVIFSASVVSTTTTDEYFSLKSGTGSNCATGTAVLFSVQTLANTPVAFSFTTPIRVGTAAALCWMHAVAGNKHLTVLGYTAP